MTHDELDQLCDEVIQTNQTFLEYVARRWAGEDRTKFRQQVNGAIVAILTNGYGLDPVMAHAYQRGFTAGVNATMNVYRPPARDA